MDPSELREWRYRLNMTQAELAEALGVATGTVARWEQGKRSVGAPTMLRLALGALMLLQ